MTPRAPLVVGLHRGAGTSTVAAGLHARDDGLCGGLRERTADIVVCGSDQASLALADGLMLAPAGPRPLLAVTAGATAPPRVRLRALEERFGAVVLLPDVARWHGLIRPLDEVGTLLAQPVEHLPRPMRSYASALRHLTAAVLRSGQLDRAVPPLVGPVIPIEPSLRAGQPAVGTRQEPQIEVRAGPRPVLISAPRPVRPIVLVGRPLDRRRALPELVPDVGQPPGIGFDLDDPHLDDADLDDADLDDADLDDEALEAAACNAAGQAG